MKLSFPWLLVIASFIVLVDSISIKRDDYTYLNDEDLERIMSPNEREFRAHDLEKEMNVQQDAYGPSYCTNSSIAICKPFTPSKILGVLKQLGATNDPAIRIANASASFLTKLKNNNGSIKPTQRKKRSSNGMCAEVEVVDDFQLIHPEASLMYVVNGVLCTSNYCFSPSCDPDSPIGECVLKKGKVRLNVFKADGNLYTKTIDVGVACKCLLFP